MFISQVLLLKFHFRSESPPEPSCSSQRWRSLRKPFFNITDLRTRREYGRRPLSAWPIELRPDEPKTLDIEVNSEFINADKFLVAVIAEDGLRHFVFATEFQLGLLQTAKRWFKDGTFKVRADNCFLTYKVCSSWKEITFKYNISF